MFVQSRPRTMAGAAFTTLALIYHQTVHSLRGKHRNAVIGLLLTIAQSTVMILAFVVMYWVFGVRHSPIRGDFLLFIMSGILLFMAFNMAVGAVAGAGKSTSAMMKHGPLNTAIAMCAAALGALYNNMLSALVLLGFYHTLWMPLDLDNWRGALAMMMLSWFSGCTVGLILLSITSWLPEIGPILTRIVRRVNMIASGKMFVANMLPGFLLRAFDWNPLFHLIDQNRGFVFINYTPHNSSLTYPLYLTLTLLMIGLMAEFVTRNMMSISYMAGR